MTGMAQPKKQGKGGGGSSSSSSSSPVFPAISLGYTILGEIFADVAVF